MSQHANVPCEESDDQWLPLIEYSVRSGISTSTIRRKIKTNSIQFRLENGRYLILCATDKKPQTAAYSMVPKEEPKEVKSEVPEPVTPRTETKTANKTSSNSRYLPLIDRSVQMATEAYERALQEKDERIRLLNDQLREMRERLDELRSLVSALEDKYQVRY